MPPFSSWSDGRTQGSGLQATLQSRGLLRFASHASQLVPRPPKQYIFCQHKRDLAAHSHAAYGRAGRRRVGAITVGVDFGLGRLVVGCRADVCLLSSCCHCCVYWALP